MNILRPWKLTIELQGQTPALQPPHRSNIPLWLALLLKRQRRVNIYPPPWLRPDALTAILEFETQHTDSFSPPPPLPPSADGDDTTSPPFIPSSVASSPPNALPYHWLEFGELLLEAASDDFEDAAQVRRLMRELREVRMAKLRAGVDILEAGGGVKMNGVGGMEVAEGRAFIGGVIDGLRKIGSSKEQARRERENEERENGYAGTADDDEDML